MKILDIASNVVAVGLLVGAGWLALRPGGVGAVAISEWRKDRAVERILDGEWDALVGEASRIGPANAKVAAVEFLDYTCFYCRRFHEDGEMSLLTRTGGSLAIRHTPRPMDARARRGAAAAICAAALDQFEAMHRYLLSDTSWYSSPSLEEIAMQAGLSMPERFATCDDHVVERVLQADSAWADRLDLHGTPAFLAPQVGLIMGAPTPKQVEGLRGDGR